MLIFFYVNHVIINIKIQQEGGMENIKLEWNKKWEKNRIIYETKFKQVPKDFRYLGSVLTEHRNETNAHS